MELNTETKQQLQKLLAEPTLVSQAHIPFLQNLINVYPYYQPLYLLLAKAGENTESQADYFGKAVLHNSGSILHRTIFETKTLIPAEDVRIINYPTWEVNESIGIASIEVAQASEPLAPLSNETNQTLLAETQVNPENLFIPVPPAPEVENLAPLESELIKVCELASADLSIESSTILAEQETSAIPGSVDSFTTNHEQETFEEIGELVMPESIRFTNEQLDEPELTGKDADSSEIAPIETIEFNPFFENETISTKHSDDLQLESISASDFFAFESFTSPNSIEEERATETAVTAEDLKLAEPVVSKYNDDKMPFTFLWWLAKTRKNHEQIFQPYVSPTKQHPANTALQQQYVEHIFHLQAPLDPITANEEIKDSTKPLTKEHELIETFIKNDPQLKVPKPDQINNENKAKKSAEDNYDLVSETLAEIYIEQMLYHKAIDTYQKLVLKFPEKSRYFADLIQSLEKKI